MAAFLSSAGILVVLVGVAVSQNTPENQAEVPEERQDPTCDSFFDYPSYVIDWRRQYFRESGNMYPFGERYCDTNATFDKVIVGFNLPIRFEIPFYGAYYRSIWISPHGFIGLNRTTESPTVPYLHMERWPNPNYPNAPDPPFIAPFYSEADFLRNGDAARLSYKLLDIREVTAPSRKNIIQGLLDEISVDIRAAFVGADTFQALYGVMVTWYKVTFAGNDCNLNSGFDNCARNTYQAVVVTDGVDTFTIFNYFNMTWVGGGSSQNCDRLTGTRTGSAQNCQPGHIGYNAGQARGFRQQSYSGSDMISNIDGLGGSNVTGRFYYKVSGDQPMRGGCTNDTSLAKTTWPLEIYPQYGGMFGGHEVNISGPCVLTADRLKCRFGESVTSAVAVDNMMRAMCVAPQMDQIGYIPFAVSVDGGANYPYEKPYLVVPMGRVDMDIEVTVDNGNWLDPDVIRLAWIPRHLTPRTNVRVDIKLFGYREYSVGDDSDEWLELITLELGYSNNGLYDFRAADYPCAYTADTDKYKCTTFNAGAFQVSIQGGSAFNPRRLWSNGVPLGWFVKTAMLADRGQDWIQYKCQTWYNEDERDTQWQSELQDCPCTLDQAYSDFGRFLPDLSCHLGSQSHHNCIRHAGALHCVISAHVTPHGAGNQCCYNVQGQLMYSGDSMYGSRPHKSHVLGHVPYQVPPNIPTLSHWVRDLVPYYYCCVWQTDPADCHSKFLSRRRTRSCSRYHSSGQGLAFGDPHFKTFDGTFYTFNGFGEFWLLWVDGVDIQGRQITFKLQARMEQPPAEPWGEIRATYITAVAMQQDGGETLVFATNQHGRDKRMLVYSDDNLVDFQNSDQIWQDFRDFMLINNDARDSRASSNFTVVYRSGVGVQVAWSNGLLQVLVSAPPELKQHTKGLLGLWNGNPSDDLEPRPPGGPSFLPQETEKVHSQFGLKWMATPTESLFNRLYQAKLNYDYYNRPLFVPVYVPVVPPNASRNSMATASFCLGDAACVFDYRTTQNQAIAMDALNIQAWDSRRRAMSTAVASCSWLNVPYSIKQEPISYLAGSQVTITGCITGYMLSGPTQYLCQDQGSPTPFWEPTVTTVCQEPNAPLSTAMIVAIAIPIALVALFLIIGLVVLIIFCRRRSQRKKEAKEVYVPVSTTDGAPGADPAGEKWADIMMPTGYSVHQSRQGTPRLDESDSTRQVAGSKDSINKTIEPGGTDTEIKENKKNKKKQKEKKSKGGKPSHDDDVLAIIAPQAMDKRPPRPPINNHRHSYDSSSDTKPDYLYDNSGVAVTDESTHKASLDTTSSDNKKRTFNSNRGTTPSQSSDEVDLNVSPELSRRPPYQYPTQDNQYEPAPNVAYMPRNPGGSPSIKPRAVVNLNPSATNNVPTTQKNVSSYYKRKYGKKGANYSDI